MVIGSYHYVRALFAETGHEDDKNLIVDTIIAYCNSINFDLRSFLTLKFPFIQCTCSLQSIYDPISYYPSF